MLRLMLALLIASFAAQAQSPPRPPRKSVAILIFDGVQIIDYTGPYEVFGQAGYKVFTVGERTNVLTTSMDMKVTPSYDFQSAPEADVVVVPGGAVPHDIPAGHPMVKWITEREGRAKYVLSVCNGAFALGATGLLDNREATTTAGMISHLQMFIPKVKPVYDKRFVHDGKFVTAGGLSAGIDASLYIVSLLETEGRAREVANKMEYNWDSKGTYVRTRLVDFELSRLLDFNPPLRGKTLIYEGDEQRWTAKYEVTRKQTLPEFAGQFIELSESLGWKSVSEKKSIDSIELVKQLTDHSKRTWKIVANFNKLPEEGKFTVLFRLELM